MDIELHGFRECQRELEGVLGHGPALAGEHSVSLSDLFPPDFMTRHTSLDTIQELMDLSGFRIWSQKDFKKIPDKYWDSYIRKVTQFPNWGAMVDEAVTAYTVRKLRL